MRTFLTRLALALFVLSGAVGASAADLNPAYFNVDTNPPLVSITTPSPGPSVNSASPTITLSGTAADDLLVISVTWSTGGGQTGVCSGLSSWSANSVPLEVGENVITVVAQDPAGNTGGCTLRVTRDPSIDTIPPSVQFTGPTSNSAYSTTTTPLTISGSASDGIGVTQVTWSNSRGGSGTCTGTTSWSSSGVSLALGTNTISVSARDASGNSGTDTLVVTYSLPADTATPAVSITSPTSGGAYSTATSSISIDGSASDNVGVTQVTWSNDRGGSGTCSETNSWTAADISLVVGANTITVSARDQAGNSGTDELVVTYTPPADTTTPAVNITGPTSSSSYTTASSSIGLSGSASDNVGVTQVTWANDRGGSGTCAGTGSWSTANIPLTLGANAITVSARDQAGNVGTDVLTVTYSLPADATAPTVSITSPTLSSSYSTTAQSINLAGSASDNVGVTQVRWSNNRGGSGTCTGTGSWSATGVSLSVGANTITVSARDLAGNWGTDTLVVTYSQPADTTAPTVSITSPTSDSAHSTTTPSISMGGSASDSTGVTLVTWANDRGGSGTCAGTGAWSADGISLDLGANTITVTARDQAGNSGTDTLVVTYSPPADTTAPSVSIASPTSDVAYSAATPSIGLGGSASDNAVVTEVTWRNDRGGSGICTGTTEWSAPAVSLHSGTNVITVTARDGSGNIADDTLTVTCSDVRRPAVSIKSPKASGTYSTAAATVSMAGVSSDDVAVASVKWATSRGHSGTCSSTTSWSAQSIPMDVGTNVVTITALDAANNSGSAQLTIVRADAGLPVVRILAPTDRTSVATSDGLLSISGESQDDSGLSQVTWANSRGTSGICSGTASWTADDLGLQVGHNVITVTARNTSGNTASDTIDIHFIGTVPPSEWYQGLTMVAVPLMPYEADPEIAVGFGDEYWCAHLGDSQTYVSYSDDPDKLTWFLPAENVPGRGFWARFNGNAKMPIGIAPPQDEPAVIHLFPGYNMVGQPFLSDLSWDSTAIQVQTTDHGLLTLKEADSLGIVRNYAYGWQLDGSDPDQGSYYLVGEPGGPATVHTLTAWCAYWIRSAVECDLILPPPPQ